MLAHEEIEKLKKKLEFYTTGSEDDFRSKYDAIHTELEAKTATIEQLEHEIKKLKKAKIQKEEEEEEEKKMSTSSETVDNLKQTIEETGLIDKLIYSSEPQYTNNVSNSASNIFRTLLAWKAFNNPRSKFLSKLGEAFEIIIKVIRTSQLNISILKAM